MTDPTPGNGADDRLAARAVELFAALSSLVTAAGLPPERVAGWVLVHAGDDDPATAAVLWADLGDWCRDVAEELAARTDPSAAG